MDPLSDLLRVVRLDGAFFYAVEAAEPWGVEAAALLRRMHMRGLGGIAPRRHNVLACHDGAR
jgi:cupin